MRPRRFISVRIPLHPLRPLDQEVFAPFGDSLRKTLEPGHPSVDFLHVSAPSRNPNAGSPLTTSDRIPERQSRRRWRICRLRHSLAETFRSAGTTIRRRLATESARRVASRLLPRGVNPVYNRRNGRYPNSIRSESIQHPGDRPSRNLGRDAGGRNGSACPTSDRSSRSRGMGTRNQRRLAGRHRTRTLRRTTRHDRAGSESLPCNASTRQRGSGCIARTCFGVAGVASRARTDLLARLLHIATVSLRRYQSGARKTPDDVSVRLHALALMTGDLAGAYNDAGIRRWFDRPRTALGNRAPVDVLAPGWRPEDQGPRQVRSLASALTASPAT